MRKVFSKINIPALLTTVALIMLILAVPDFTYAQGGSSPGFWSRVASAFEAALLAIPGAISIIILKLATLLTHLSGMILNYVVQFTVVEMSAKIEGLPMINLAWRTIRDVANMAFIFVLLYAAITTILGMGEDNKKLIVRVVIVAILINFSLFFTKLVIDASNVIAISFYDAIAPGATAQNLNLGISSNLMGVLNLQSIYDATGGIPGADLLTIGVMGTILALVAAFVFFAISIMLVIRFVVLIFTMILSPIAFMSFILPQLSKYRDQWWNALSGQAFFAPIYFLLTWIVIVISRGILGATGGTNGNLATALGGMVGPSGERIPANEGSIALLVNFIIVIVLLIASLMIAKEWANKAGSGVSSATKWAMGAAGGATFGMAARLGRNTIGAGADRLAQSDSFQRWAGRSAVGQKLYQATGKAAQSSFDLRATRVGEATVGQIGAGEAKQGGYRKTLQEKQEKREKFAQTLNATTSVAGRPSARESYATRISGGPMTHGGTRNSANTIMGTLGRHNRVAASKILQNQLAPLETQQQNLQNRENQLNQQLANMTNEQAMLSPLVAAGTANAQQIARLTALNDVTAAIPPGAPPGTPAVPTNRNSIAYAQHHLTQTQADLARADAEVTRIRGVIDTNQLTNPANQVVNPVTGRSRNSRADEQNY